MLKMDQEDDSYVMTYQGCVNEIRLPNTEFWLSNVDRLIVPLEAINQLWNRLQTKSSHMLEMQPPLGANRDPPM